MKKTSPPSTMKIIVTALSTLGYEVADRERTPGALKAWMNPADKDAAKKVGVASFRRALSAAGLSTTAHSDRYETILRGQGFEVVLPSGDEITDVGSDVFVSVFAGPRATEERMGLDTSDL